MNFYFIMLLFFIVWGLKINFKDFNPLYLSKEKTAMIKGIFILIVLYSHFSGYIMESFAGEIIMQILCNKLGQLMVTLFLFYSGYGIYESIKSKGEKYIDSIPKGRILKTLLHFDIAVAFMAIVQLWIGKIYSIKTYILSLIGWDTVGNSNWYIFSILLLYVLTYLSFKIFNRRECGILSLCISSIILVFILSLVKDSYWYNTLLVYPIGMIYSYYKENIEKYIFNNKIYFLTLMISLVVFVIIRKFSYLNYVIYEVEAIVFSLIIVLITMKIEVNSKILKWMGENLFWIYILQRVPMVMLAYYGMNESFPKIMLWLSLLFTILLVIPFKKFGDKVDSIF